MVISRKRKLRKKGKDVKMHSTLVIEGIKC